MTRRRLHSASASPAPGASGFSLIELMVSLMVFLVIGTAAVMLVQKHVQLFNAQQGQSALNVTLRQAIAQIQSDGVNAGTGYYTNVNAPGSPIGMTVANTTGAYDTLTILSFDSTVPTKPTASQSLLSGTCGSTTSCSVTLTSCDSTVTNSAIKAKYVSGSELLFLTGGTSTPSVMTVKLTQAAYVDTTTGNIVITFAPVASVGTAPSGGTAYGRLSDPNKVTSAPTEFTKVTTFDVNSSVLLLTPIVYQVDTTTDPSSPRLLRVQNGGSAVIADRVVAFKVGVEVWHKAASATVPSDDPQYFYDSGPYNNNFSLLRGVRVTLVARTANEPDSAFKNSFDQGHYRVEAISTTVSPRNLNMNDN